MCKHILGAACAKRGSPLQGLRCESSGDVLILWRCRTIGLDARPTQRGAALRLAAGLRPPTTIARLGSLSGADRTFIRCRLPLPSSNLPRPVWIMGCALNALARPLEDVGGSYRCRKRKSQFRQSLSVGGRKMSRPALVCHRVVGW